MNKNDLKKIINGFASRNVIFSNEQDFQFRLAIELRNYGYVVEVEKLSIEQQWSCFRTNLSTKLPEKQYTDMVVKDKNGQYTAIELKYATPSKVCYYDMKPNSMITVQQGGYTYKRYWYINDIMRLENINSKFGMLGRNQITKSFAIMLSNDSSYYNKDPRTIWKNYSIKDGSCLG